MRSLPEIKFRLRQEVANALLAVSSPRLELRADLPLAILPHPTEVAGALRDSDYVRELTAIADEILCGRIPILGQVIDYGPEIAWRRDPHRGTETAAKYFRRIPYLDLAAVGDHKFIWELNRHQHLVLLAQAAALTGGKKYSDRVFQHIEQWWAENPFQRGINWSSALEVGFRALSWIWIFHLIGDCMMEEFRGRFLAELYRHGSHVEYNLSIYFSPNTHLLGEAVALHALGRLLPQFPRADKWRSVGGNIVREHMQKCVKDDGSYFEQSTYYHMYALDMFAFHAVLEPASPTYLDKLGRMVGFLAAIVNEKGELPFLGDDDGGRFFHPYGQRPRFARASLAVSSILTGKRFFPCEDRDLDEIAMWWLGRERSAVQLPTAGTSSPTRLFADTGIAVLRQGPVVVIFDAGPFGPGSAGHSHSDTLSLVVAAGDHELLIDSGTFSYMDPEWRSYFRGSSAHNTIRIDGCDQAVSLGPFRWTQKPEAGASVRRVFTEDASVAFGHCIAAGFRFSRFVELNEDGVTVIDGAQIGPPGEHLVEQYWHFATEPRQLVDDIWTIGGVAEFRAQGGVVEPAWRSRCYGSKELAWAIVVRRRTTLPFELDARLRFKL